MIMTDQDEFNGDACIVLPKDYLNSAEAVAEIYEEQLSEAATSFDVDQFRPRFFRGTILVGLIWALPAIWSVCF